MDSRKEGLFFNSRGEAIFCLIAGGFFVLLWAVILYMDWKEGWPEVSEKWTYVLEAWSYVSYVSSYAVPVENWLHVRWVRMWESPAMTNMLLLFVVYYLRKMYWMLGWQFLSPKRKKEIVDAEVEKAMKKWR